jgi:hypothetical protein
MTTRPPRRRLAWGLALLAVASCHSGAFVIADIDAEPKACSGRVLMVVGTDPLTGGDNAIRDRLRNLGYSTVIVEAASATVADANGADFGFISRTTHAVDFNAAFRELPLPLMVPEYGLYSFLGMTGPTLDTDWGALTLATTDLLVTDPSHPLAAGLSGTVTVMTPGTGLYGFGVPAAGAAKVATPAGKDGLYAIFGYERGADMAGLAAPARRVGWFVDKDAATRLTASGWALFDAAVKWTAGACPP